MSHNILPDVSETEAKQMIEAVCLTEKINVDVKVLSNNYGQFISVQLPDFPEFGRQEFEVKKTLRFTAWEAANCITDFKKRFDELFEGPEQEHPNPSLIHVYTSLRYDLERVNVQGFNADELQRLERLLNISFPMPYKLYKYSSELLYFLYKSDWGNKFSLLSSLCSAYQKVISDHNPYICKIQQSLDIENKLRHFSVEMKRRYVPIDRLRSLVNVDRFLFDNTLYDLARQKKIQLLWADHTTKKYDDLLPDPTSCIPFSVLEWLEIDTLTNSF